MSSSIVSKEAVKKDSYSAGCDPPLSNHPSITKIKPHHDGTNPERNDETEGVIDSQYNQQRGLAMDSGLREREVAVRASVKRRSHFLTHFIVNGYSAILVFIFYLISLESVFAVALSVSLTIVTYDQIEKNEETFDGSIMNWVLLSFAIITPMSASIGMAFTRREQALTHLAVLKSTFLSVYSAHASWDWSKMSSKGPSGRQIVCPSDEKESNIFWMNHADSVLRIILQICSELTRMLTLPNASRARHRVTRVWKSEAKELSEVTSLLYRSILLRMAQLTNLCEVIKHKGLPPNEATRIRQWERIIIERLESLRTIKKYRTPQALRSFARLFSVFLPPFYAPFFAQMARDMNSLGIAIAFSALTSIALTSLFESISQMEDPFVGIIALDGINLTHELQGEYKHVLLDWRNHFFHHAKPFVLQCERDKSDDIIQDAPQEFSIKGRRLQVRLLDTEN